MVLQRFDGPRITLVVNPSAGRGRARRLLPKVCAELLTKLPDAHLQVHQATSFDDARLRSIQAVENARPVAVRGRSDALVVMGGDGMAHLGVNACATSDVPLGVIPAGTGNDFCRGAGIPSGVLDATRAIVGGRIQRIDVTRAAGPLVGGAETRFVGSVISTGYDARVNRRTNELTLPLGPLAYAWVALKELATFEPLHYRLVLDGEPREVPAMFVAVGNAGYFGGGMEICPGSDVTDGLLDITIVHPVSRATLLRLLPLTYSGRFANDPAVEQFRVKQVTIDGDHMFAMADGEELGDVPVQASCLHRSLSVYVPS